MFAEIIIEWVYRFERICGMLFMVFFGYGGMGMSNVSRKLGINIDYYIRKNNNTLEGFAEKVGCSVRDIQSIVEGKVLLSPNMLEDIAKALNISREDLVSNDYGNRVPELQYRKKIKNPDNLDKILDLMDEYVKCRECISE